MLDVQNLSVQFGGRYLFRDAAFKVNTGDRISLVGSNGSGKSTLLKIIMGRIEAETGRIATPRRFRIGYLPQELTEIKGATLFDAVKSSLEEIDSIEREENQLRENLLDNDISDAERSALVLKLGELHHRKEEIDFYKIDSDIKKVLTGLGFEESEFLKPVSHFSGGWQMRIQLAKILVSDFDLILLDEPTNHLDISSLRWLISFLKSYKGSLIIVSHDRHFIMSLTDKTLEIFNSNITLFNGNYDEYLNFKSERDRRIIAEYANVQKKVKETERFIERFRYKATKARQVQSRIKRLEKLEIPELPSFESEIRLKFPEPPRSNAVPIKLIKISKSFGSKSVLENIDLEFERGDKVAFVGPNGAGKTTLAKIIAGQLEPTSGEFSTGDKTVTAYYAQEVSEELDLELDIIDTISEISGNLSPLQIRTLMGAFLFTDEDIFKKIGVLSGGEKSRVALAGVMTKKANFIILDEPTNHLDHKSKEILQHALTEFEGSIILVSHDISFMRPIVNKVLELKGKKARLISGGIDYYIEKLENEETEEERQTGGQTQSRKEQKRIEAEIRTKRYRMTKDLKDEIHGIEGEIESLEQALGEIERELTSEETFRNPGMLRDKSREYERLKSELRKSYEIWEAKTAELEKIESEFENLF